MDPLSFNLSAFVPAWRPLIYFIAGATATYIYLRFLKAHQANAAPESDIQPSKVVYLTQINPGKTREETDIDIIALHGLDTKSPDTWTYSHPAPSLKGSQHENLGEVGINWLENENMLPANLGPARIFTCDWPAELFRPLQLIQMDMEEYARLLLETIQGQLFDVGDDEAAERPIFFIASCFGGIILINALSMADDKNSKYHDVGKATRGIVFLATPFRGTSYQHIAGWVEPFLKIWAAVRGRDVNQQLGSVKAPTMELGSAVQKFTSFRIRRGSSLEIRVFYELGVTNLSKKLFHRLPTWLQSRGEPLVDRSRASLDVEKDAIPLSRTHVLMNKFEGPSCPDYILVAQNIKCMLHSIRKYKTPLQKADAAILNHYYEVDRLKIKRLSGDQLPIDQCYINLAIMERNQNGTHEERGSRSEPFAFPCFSRRNFERMFPLSSRWKTETMDESSLIKLEEIFDTPRRQDESENSPRRVLIRGRAGVGKTTLCKKIVYEFVTNKMWRDKFDRILWIPLRNLNQEARKINCSNMQDLLYHEFFKTSSPASDENFAAVIDNVLSEDRTLFLLDGWDEIIQLVEGDDDISNFLRVKFRPLHNVIITSRPSVAFTAWDDPFDLELETVGFNQAQVDEYIEEVHKTDVDEIRGFLQDHHLVQSLVRIPIQLDALCYCWGDEDFMKNSGTQTMAGLYAAIQTRLWKKDISRLNKHYDNGDKVTQYSLKGAEQPMTERQIKPELEFLELLAFAGLLEDVVEFNESHQNKIWEYQDTPVESLQATLPELSVLRSSDPNPNHVEGRSYHFIHLTFQEYYAARYFVRRWNKKTKYPTFGKQHTENFCPAKFLLGNKYNPRYDIMWRFVAGLFSIEDLVYDFLKEVGNEPLDLLGPSHQRLVMRCLHEIPPSKIGVDVQMSLEKNLSNWLLFESQFMEQVTLASEAAFPDKSLHSALQEATNESKRKIQHSIKARSLSLETIKMACHIKNDNDYLRRDTLQFLFRQSNRQFLLPSEITDVLANNIPEDAEISKILLNQSNLSELHSELVVEMLMEYKTDTFLNIFRSISIIPKAFAKVFTERLLQSSEHSIWIAGDEMPQIIFNAFDIRLIHPGSPEIKLCALKLLKYQWNLSKTDIDFIIGQLDEPDLTLQTAALRCLINLKDFPPAVRKAFIKYWRSLSLRLRRKAVRIFDFSSRLPDTLIEATIELLEDSDTSVREATLVAMKGRKIESKRLVEVVSKLVEDLDPSVRKAALKTLKYNESLSESTINTITWQLQDRDPIIRKAALKALKSNERLPERAVSSITEQLQDLDLKVRDAAVDVLKHQSIRSEAVANALAGQLNGSESGGREVALRALDGQPELSQDLLFAVAKLLEDSTPSVRKAALSVLGKQAILPNHLLLKIIEMVEDSDRGVRLTALGALEFSSSLPPAGIKVLTKQLLGHGS